MFQLAPIILSLEAVRTMLDLNIHEYSCKKITILQKVNIQITTRGSTSQDLMAFHIMNDSERQQYTVGKPLLSAF